MRHCQGQLCSQWPSSWSRLGSLGRWEAPATWARRLGDPEPEVTGHLSVGIHHVMMTHNRELGHSWAAQRSPAPTPVPPQLQRGHPIQVWGLAATRKPAARPSRPHLGLRGP